jgi:non-specific serine/threonine protein kinase
MGLGKTIQVLTLLELERAAAVERNGGARPRPGDLRPTLLICPMSLVANWQREAARFTPELEVHVHHGAERLSGEQFRAAVADTHLVITTYGLALRDRTELAAVDWHRVVIDEAQAVKNAGTKQSRAVRALSAPHRVALTGTPVENRLTDLWSILEFANPGLLGSAESFKERFARPIERDGDERAAERLRRATGAFVLRREKTDPAIISDLPEKVEMKVVCNLTKEQASLYQATVDEMLREIADASKGVRRRGLVLALLTRLKQICNHPAHFLRDGSRLPGRSGKLARVEELCDEVLAAGEKALLFTQYAEFGGMLRAHLAERFGREVAFLYGGVPKRARDEMVQRFEQTDGPPLFVLSLKAGGVGLNLTAANHVIHVDRWWNPAVENQATDRAFRIGQQRNVQVRKLMCAGTLEERIDRVIEEKQDLAERIVGTGEGWLTELSVAQLRDVIRLAADAVVE